MATKKRKVKRPGIVPKSKRDYEWYRKQRVALKRYYHKHPDHARAVLDFKIPSKKVGFSDEERREIAWAYADQLARYDRYYEQLKPYVKFNFRKRRTDREWTASEKRTLSFYYNKYKPTIKLVEDKLYTAIPLKTKKGKRKVPEKIENDFKSTNKVVFIPQRNAEITIKKKPNQEINYTITSKTPDKLDGIQRTAIYIPYPKYVYDDPTLIPYFMYWLATNYPDFVFRLSYRGLMKDQGVVFTTEQWGYIQARFEAINYGDEGNPITGVWAIYYGVKDLKRYWNIDSDVRIDEIQEDIFNEFGDSDPEATIRAMVETD